MIRAEGFAQIPIWMMRDKNISRRACLVYASLSSRSGLGAIYPSQATIAEEAGVSERTARAALAELEEMGVIERRSRRSKEGRSTSLTTAYLLHPNGRFDESAIPADSSKGPAKGPADIDRGTGNELQAVPPIEADKEKADRDLFPAVDPSDEAFERAWSLWPTPRRGTTKTARPKFDAALRLADIPVLLAAIERDVAVWRTWPASDVGFIPLLATWLHQERWTSAPPLPRTGGSFVAQRQDENLALLARYADTTTTEGNDREQVRGSEAAGIRQLHAGRGGV